MTYDDERVIALLKDSVPAVPEAPARVDAVRRLAARQRSFAAAQVVATAAAVVLLVAAAAVLSRPGGGPDVEPVRDPVRTMLDAFLARESVKAEITTTVSGASYEPMNGTAVSRAAFRLDGTMQVDEPVSIGSDVVVARRVVDGVTYRTADIGEELPPGKKWIRTSEPAPGRADLAALLERFGNGLRDVRHVRETVVRGVPVAEYAATVDGSAVDFDGVRVPVTFALDSDGLPRRVTLTVDLGGLGRVDLAADLFGYDEPVVVSPPPAHEVVTQREVKLVPEGPDAKTELWACTSGRVLTTGQLDSCLRRYEQRTGAGVTCRATYRSPDAWEYACSDGTAGRSDE